MALQPVTPETINDLKARHGEKRLRKVTVESDGQSYEFIIKKPSRAIIEAVGKHKNDAAAANKVLVANCVLAGDDEAFENDGEVFSAVIKEVGALMEKAKVTVAKL